MSLTEPMSRPVAVATGSQLPERPARDGARAALPLLVGLVPFGLSVGAAVAASADPLAAWVGTLLIYSGSAQLALLQTLQDGAPLWAAVAAAVLVNARLTVYAAGLAPLWRGRSPAVKVLGAAAIVEPTWAVAQERMRTRTDGYGALAHYGGAAAAVTVGWTAIVSVGALVGRLPQVAPHLAVAAPLGMIAIVVPHLRMPGGAAAVTAAVGAALAGRALLPGTEILVAMAAAAVAGLLATRRGA